MNLKEELEYGAFLEKILKNVIVRKKTEKEGERVFEFLDAKNEENADKFLERAIEHIKDMGYINDKKYAELFVQDYINLKRNSIYEIRMKLKQKGIKEEYIIKAFELYEEELRKYEIDNLIKILKTKKYGVDFESDRKIMNYIYRKGYKTSNISIAKDEYNYMKEDEEY